MLQNNLGLLGAATRTALEHEPRVFIGGEWQTLSDSLPAIDPSSATPVARIAAAGAVQIDAAVRAARAAFETGPWPRMHGAEREALLRRLADLVERDRQTLAELEVVDVGMPIPDSAFFGYTQKEPLGVVGAIIPWNVPLMMSVWKLAPALAAGCTVVLKPSEEASLSVLYLAGLVREAGFPAGVVNVVTGSGPEAGAALAAHPGLDKITFTGSTRTGTQVALAAARNVTKATLELGGKSPQILFADADLDTAIPGIAASIFLNSGQVCVAGSRLYVDRRIYAEAVDRLARHADAMRLGAGLAPDTELGPLVNARQQQHVLQHLDAAQQAGAELLTAAPRIDAAGFYVRPSVVAVADQSAAIVREELFGPVITVTPFDGVDEAVQMANDTPYGLSACLWTRDLATMHSVVPRIRSGKVAVNTEPMPWPGLPEGGRRASGYGRDLGEESFESFLETKSVLVRYA